MSASDFGPWSPGLSRHKWRVRLVAWVCLVHCYSGPVTDCYERLLLWLRDTGLHEDSPHRMASLAAFNALPTLHRRRVMSAYLAITKAANGGRGRA